MAKKIEYPKLPPVFKAKWLAALRSGDFEKGQFTLHNKTQNNYCCLDVACRINHKQKVLAGAFIDENTFKKDLDKIRVPKILKGDSDNNIVTEKLSDMNDSGKYSFKQIANWIDKNL